jgi:hypothetical protein
MMMVTKRVCLSRIMKRVSSIQYSIKSKMIYTCLYYYFRLLRIRKDDKGKPLKRSMLGSVEDFIESYRKKSPNPPAGQMQSRTNGKKSMKTERLP